MKVSELINRLRQFDPDSEVHVQCDSHSFASPAWVGIVDTGFLFDEKKDFQLVISPWAPEEYLKLGSDLVAKEQKKTPDAGCGAQARGYGQNHAGHAAHSQ